MSQSTEGRSPWSNVLIITGVSICAAATYIEFHRALDGHARAWMYTVQWPLIAAFLIWIWHRYRTDGNVLGGVAQHYQDRVDEASTDDPQLRAWQEYVDKLDREEP